jgi:hypothetical protein
MYINLEKSQDNENKYFCYRDRSEKDNAFVINT